MVELVVVEAEEPDFRWIFLPQIGQASSDSFLVVLLWLQYLHT